MRIIFFGPPGAGKGTQANLLSSFLSIPHLSTGEILRKRLMKKDRFSSELENIMSSGKLVSDSILNNIVSERILTNDCDLGFILDGYPRTKDQLNFLNEFNEKNNIFLNYIINIKIDYLTIQKRVLSRAKIEDREDDNIETLLSRISTYNVETKPILDYYKSNHNSIYNEINGDNEVEYIQKNIRKVIKKC